MTNNENEALAALAIIQAALLVDEKQRAAAIRATGRMAAVFLDEGLGIGHMISVMVRFTTSIAAEQKWSKKQLLAIVGAIHDAVRPSADAAYAAGRS